MTSHHSIIGSTLPAFLMAGLLMIAYPARNVAARTTGEQDFDAHCATCHGTDGKGHGEGLRHPQRKATGLDSAQPE